MPTTYQNSIESYLLRITSRAIAILSEGGRKSSSQLRKLKTTSRRTLILRGLSPLVADQYVADAITEAEAYLF